MKKSSGVKAEKKELKKRLKRKYGLSDEEAGLAALYIILQKQPPARAASQAEKTIARLERLVKQAKRR